MALEVLYTQTLLNGHLVKLPGYYFTLIALADRF